MSWSLSVIVLSHNQLELTSRCVDSLRSNTDIAYELIVVDNGSIDGSAEFAMQHADTPVLLSENYGFARGMNQGLAHARGEIMAFVNNDTVFPPGWASTLTTHLADQRVGLVVPAVTAAGNPVSVRSEPGTDVITLNPFGELPSGVVYLLRSETIRQLGGWNENYPIATGEDLDLLFTLWTNGLEIVLDTRVLIEHVSQGTLASRADRHQLRQQNLDLFLNRWRSDEQVPKLPNVVDEEYQRNRRFARSAATWLARLVEARANLATAQRQAMVVPAETAPLPRPRRFLRRSG